MTCSIHVIGQIALSVNIFDAEENPNLELKRDKALYRTQTKNQEIWIIGYGNPRLGDDGIGPYIVKVLKKCITDKEGICFCSILQLTPGLIKDLQNATLIIFIEATVEKLKKGWRFLKVQPDFSYQPCLAHQVTPGFLLGQLQSVYKRYPSVWLVYVQGYDFGLEEEFYPETEKNIEGAISFIYHFVKGNLKQENTEGIKKKGE